MKSARFVLAALLVLLVSACAADVSGPDVGRPSLEESGTSTDSTKTPGWGGYGGSSG